MVNVYGSTSGELKDIKYNSKFDLPAEFNRLDKCDLSIKTTGRENSVCMADCLRVFDAVSSGEPFHMVVIYYNQNDANKTKKISTIVEVDLTNSREALFGSLLRSQVEELDTTVKSVPQKRKPTKDERTKMYSLRNSLQGLSESIHLDIKCNSTQSRLQCSFNRWKKFLVDHKDRIIAASVDHNFRGGTISSAIDSPQRVFKRRQ